LGFFFIPFNISAFYFLGCGLYSNLSMDSLTLAPARMSGLSREEWPIGPMLEDFLSAPPWSGYSCREESANFYSVS